MKSYLLALTLFLSFNAAFSQKEKIDSLQRSLKVARTDTSKINILTQLSTQLRQNGENEKALETGEKALRLSKKIKYTPGIEASNQVIGAVYMFTGIYDKAEIHLEQSLKLSIALGDKVRMGKAYNSIGILYEFKSDILKAKENYQKALNIFLGAKDKTGIADSYNNLGIIADFQGNYPDALRYHLKSLKVNEQSGDNYRIATSINNVGVIYSKMGKHQESFVYFSKALKIRMKMGYQEGIGDSYNCLGICYKNLNNYPKALEYQLKSLKIKQASGNKAGIADAYSNLGNLYLLNKDYEKALEFQFLALDICLELNDKEGEATCLNNIGLAQFDLKQYDKAEVSFRKSLKIGREMNLISALKDSYDELSKLYLFREDYQKAYENYKLYIKYRDSLMNDENLKKTTQLQLTYDFEKKEASLKAKQEKKNLVHATESKNQRLLILLAVVGLVVLGIFLFIIFKRFKISQEQKKVIESQKHEVEEKNREITDSISYAKRIQQAILPQDKNVKSIFPDSFILYRPKDIVAGDFYWFETAGGLNYIAAADCTGHGVPGALVSVICHNALNRSLKEFAFRNPADILKKTREIVISEFEKSDEDVKDGMDISLCCFDLINKKLHWSGAHNPLWILRNREIIEYKGDKQPVGKFFHEKDFTKHEINIEENDEFYIFTDGFQDQFGGGKGKKFKASQLKQILLDKQNFSMPEKLKLLGERFENWKQDYEQVDDVCVIGLKI